MELSRGTEDWPNGPDTLKPEQLWFYWNGYPAINKSFYSSKAIQKSYGLFYLVFRNELSELNELSD